MGKEVGSTEIQAVLYDVFTTLGFVDETEEDENCGGDLEFGLSLWNASRLMKKAFFICADGRAKFRSFGAARGDENMGCTEIQSQVVEALSGIGFRPREDKTGRIGGPTEFTLPQDVARRLRRTNILVSADGSVRFEK